LFLINKTGRSEYDPERPVLSSASFQLPMRLALAVVFLASDMVRGTILCRADPGPFPFRHHTIGHCPVFHLVHMFLLPVQPVRFSLVQLPARNPLINPLILIRLALINHRRFYLGKDYSTHHQRHRTDREQQLLH
jgi:hypothetical protein